MSISGHMKTNNSAKTNKQTTLLKQTNTYFFFLQMNDDTPTNKLTPTAIEWCKDLGRNNITTVEDILNGPDGVIMGAIQAGIDRSNKMAVSNAARVQRWTILPSDVSMPGGELGPTLKLKRFAFNKKYNDAIGRLYE